MMRRNWLTVTAAVLGLALVMGGMMFWFGHRRQAKLAELAPQLEAIDPFDRLKVGREMLDLDARRADARMAMADAYITLGKHKDVHTILQPVLAGRSKVRPRALAISIDSLLTEAGDAITRAAPRSLDVTVQRVEGLLDEAETLRADLARTHGVKVMVAMIEARMIETRAALLDVRIAQRELSLKRDKAGTPEPVTGLWIDAPAPTEDAQLKQWRNELAQLNTKLERFCVRAARMDANMPTPYAVLFRLALRRGEYDLARKAAGKLGRLPGLSRRLAGRTAETLLNLERQYHTETRRVDIALAQRLLTHDELEGIATLRYTLARATLALRIGRPDIAAETLAPVLERYPGHPHATILLAGSLVDRGRAAEAVDLLVALNDRVPTVEGRYAEARAHHAAGHIDRGNDLLRQALELDSTDLPSLIAIAGALAQAGHINEAVGDIAIAAQLAPHHSAVIALQTQLLVEGSDHGDLVDRYKATFKDRPVTADDALLAAAMMLDDTDRVTAEVDRRLERDPSDVRALIGKFWTAATPHARADVAGIAVATLLEQVDRDPLLWPGPPALPAMERRAGADALRSPLLPSPHELALEMVDVALDRWPDQPLLKQIRGDLGAALGHADAAGFQQPDTPLRKQWATLLDTGATSDEALKALLTEHPWDLPAVLLAMRRHVEAGDFDAAERIVELAGRINAKLGLLARSRLHLARGDHAGALHDATMMTRDEPVGSFVRYYGGEINARAHLAAGSSELAVNVLENLAISSPMGQMRVKLAAIDALAQVERDNAAIAAVIAMTDDVDLEPRWLDRLMARAEVVMPARRRVGMIDAMLDRMGDEPLLLVYKAQALIESGDLTSAHQALALATMKRPDAPRVKMLQATLAQSLGSQDAADAIYRSMVETPGRAGIAARMQLMRRGSTVYVSPEFGGVR